MAYKSNMIATFFQIFYNEIILFSFLQYFKLHFTYKTITYIYSTI